MDGFIFSDIIPARIVHYGYGGGGAIWKVTLDQFQPYFCNSASLLSVHIRSLGDVSRVITFAKLNEEDLLPVTQVFFQLWRTFLFPSTPRSSPLPRPFVAVTWNYWRCLRTLQTRWPRERYFPSGLVEKDQFKSIPFSSPNWLSEAAVRTGRCCARGVPPSPSKRQKPQTLCLSCLPLSCRLPLTRLVSALWFQAPSRESSTSTWRCCPRSQLQSDFTQCWGRNLTKGATRNRIVGWLYRTCWTRCKLVKKRLSKVNLMLNMMDYVV